MMIPMLPADSPLQNGPSSARLAPAIPRRRGLVALLAAAVAIAPGAARAETGAPLPQGYTSDIPAPGAAAARAPALPVQKVDDADAEADESDEYADNDPSALTDFNEPLSPYGTWTTDATYGTVWVPNASVVGADFAPYQTAGHWSLTDDDEWLWVSDYDWGYIPFHYGRWIWINGQGWAWIPGRTYAPAWVSWRIGDGGYIGWAPMPPTWYWSGGVATNLWVTPYAAYCFVPTTHIFHERVYHYVVRDAATVRTIAAGTRAYKPAHPTVVTHGAGASGSARSGHRFRVAAPSLADAGVPRSAVPKVRVSYDTRSRAFATRSATAATRRAMVSGHGFAGGGAAGGSLGRPGPARGGDFTPRVVDRSPGRDARGSSPVLRTPRDPQPVEAPASRPSGISRPAPFTPADPVARPSGISRPAPFTPADPVARPSGISRPAPYPAPVARPSGISRPTYPSPAPVTRPSGVSRPSSIPSVPSHSAPRTYSSPSASGHAGGSSGGHSGGHAGGGRHR